MHDAIVGRESELEAAEHFLDAVAHGAACLLLEGEPGIGKTTLWRAACRRADARGAHVLQSRPGSAEARLTYAGLLDLLGPIGEEVIGELSAPQRRALEIALLRSDATGSAPDQRSVSTGFLSILRTLSRSTPIVLAIDDLQWLDTSTWRVVQFALRRLETEEVGFLAALRLERGAPVRAGLTESLPKERTRRVRLGPVNLAALHEIIKRELGHAFARPMLVRIERASAGNPFFALELARAVLESGGSTRAAGPLVVPDDLTELITRRVRRLPIATQHALLVASALSQPTLDRLDRQAIGRAEEAGILRVDERGRVSYTHPLLASAVYGSASVARRREIHRDLAARTSSPEERARHLALATDAPDEKVAVALVDAAGSARGRGAPDTAVELLELACGLTPKDDLHALHAREIELARSLYGAGDPPRARDVLRKVVAEVAPGSLRARALLLLALAEEGAGGSEVATELCERALLDARGDRGLLAEIHAAASRLCDHDAPRKRAHAQAALDLAGAGWSDGRLRAYVLLAHAEAEFYSGRGIHRDTLEEATRLVEPEGAATAASAPGHGHPSRTTHFDSDVRPAERLLGILGIYADDLEPARAVFAAARRVEAENGDEAQLAVTLSRLATIELKAGRWGLADGHLQEMARLVERIGQPTLRQRMLALRGRLDTLLGHVESARAAADEALAIAVGARWAWETTQSHATLGLYGLTVGDLGTARAELDQADEGYRRMGLAEPSLIAHQADHVEALIADGDLERAEAALARFEMQGQAARRPWALATAARCRGLLLSAAGDLEDALRALERACAEHASTPLPFELGRTLLVRGQIHRRLKQRSLARKMLLESLGIFERLGAPLWAERARAELERIGLPRRLGDTLTPTEERVAALAATGLTNREIAERAFLSPKTVEANLARVYGKLGIHSRAQLGRMMAERERVLTK